jgi:hypothetical protein
MIVLIVTSRSRSAGYDVQVALFANGKPGMLSVMKRLGYGIQPNYIAVKRRAFLKIGYINSNVVEHGLWRLSERRSGHPYHCYKKKKALFHGECFLNVSFLAVWMSC